MNADQENETWNNASPLTLKFWSKWSWIATVVCVAAFIAVLDKQAAAYHF